MFGIGAHAGRTLMAKDDTSSAPPAAVMSYHTWQTNFGGDPSVIGAAFNINTTVYGGAGGEKTLESHPQSGAEFLSRAK